MSLIRKHGAVLQAWACLDLVRFRISNPYGTNGQTLRQTDGQDARCGP